MAMPSTGDYVDLHELAKGWKAAIARAKDPATRYGTFTSSYHWFCLYFRNVFMAIYNSFTLLHFSQTRSSN
jgi:hypothetical protein